MNKNIIEPFHELYYIHKSLGNIWEAKSYKNIVNILEKYPTQIKSHKNVEKLENINGIGKNTIEKINEIIKTGSLSILDKMKNDKDIKYRLELNSVMGIGPKKAKEYVYQGIKGRNDLYKKWKNDKIKLTNMQIIGLKYYKELNRNISRKYIDNYSILLKKALEKINTKIIIAGSYKRCKKKINDIDIIVYTPKIKTKKDLTKYSKEYSNILIETLKKNNLLKLVIQKGIYDIMYINNDIYKVDIKISPISLLPYFILYFSSGENFSRKIRKIAKDKGYKLSRWGLQKIKNGKIYNIKNNISSEKNIFDILNIDYIKFENR